METKTQEDIDSISTIAAITNTLTGIDSWWIGLRNDSEWMWSQSGEDLGNDTNWGDGEPNGEGNCVILNSNFTWQTEDCDFNSTTLAPICQQCQPSDNCTVPTTTTPPTTEPTVTCPNGWIDAQSHDLGCVNFFNEVSLSWFEAYKVCQEKYSGSLVEALTSEEAEFLFEVAEMIHLYSSNETWWIGLTDFVGRHQITLEYIKLHFKKMKFQ